MTGKLIFTVVFTTLYLFTYCLLLLFEDTWSAAGAMLLFSPVLLAWMVFTVLRYGKYNGRELGEDEFGYQDKRKEELGMF